ncbi:MAG: DUF11 domain-containing protein, partial [Planctomycetales bacterium]|nr:DUF11 domain-containing protein [Planctomycetales bacterium]
MRLFRLRSARRILSKSRRLALARRLLRLESLENRRLLATINVAGACTLIDAISSANSDTAIAGCTAGSGADTIALQANSTHTFTTINNGTTGEGDNGLPVISSNITIEGNGSTIRRDTNATDKFRLFFVVPSGTLTLKNSTVTGGVATRNTPDADFHSYGGGIRSSGTLHIINSQIIGNTAGRGGGVAFTFNGGGTISGSTISGNSSEVQGGGVHVRTASVTISNTTVSGNNGGTQGGGISGAADSSSSQLWKVIGSTISGNTAFQAGGLAGSGITSLANSTVSGNLTNGGNGGGVINFGTMSITNSTITANQKFGGAGGILVKGPTTLTNTIVANQVAGANIQFEGGSIVSNGHNLISDNSGGLTGPGDINNGIANLGSLQNNGGPTLTHSLLVGSQAINAGDNTLATEDGTATGTALTTDQRGAGFARKLGSAVDIGAFESTISASLGFSVAGPTVAGGMAQLQFTITNLDPANGIGGMGFTSNLNAALPGLSGSSSVMTGICGGGSAVVAGANLILSGANLAPGASCSFSVPVQVPANASPGTYPITTSDVQNATGVVAFAKSANLVIEPPPTFGATFSPATIGQGEITTLTFTVDNSASALAATNLSFTDNLPAGVVIAATPNASSTLTGGTLAAAAGATSISFVGGSLAAGATGTISVDVTSAAAGTFINSTGDLTSSSGNSGPASNTLTVLPKVIGVAKNATVSGTQVTFDYYLENFGGVDLNGLALPDNLDSVFGAGNYTIVTGPTLLDDPGTITLNAGFNGSSNTSLIVSSSSLPVGETAQIRIVVNVTGVSNQGSGFGVYSNQVTASAAAGTITDLSDSGTDPDPNGNANPNEAGENDPTVFSLPVADLSITKTDGVTTATPGGSVTYTITASNAGPSAVVGATVSDIFPVALNNVSWTSVGSGGGTGTASGNGDINDTVNLPVGGSITYTVSATISAAATGSLVNTATVAAPGGVTDPSLVNNSATDTDTLSPLADLSITQVDSADPLSGGAAFSYTLDVNNAGPSTATNISISDTLPAGVAFVSASGTGWSVTESLGTLTFTRASLNVGAAPAITINVTAPSNPGTFSNTATVSGAEADNNTANNSATEATTVVAPPTFTAMFAPDSIAQGDITTLTFTIDNTASSLAATNLSFSNSLPAGVVIATPANASITLTGGILTAAPGSDSISYTGGSIAAGLSGTISVDVTSITVGAFINSSGILTSSLGNSGTAADSLTVNEPASFGS